MSSRSCNLTPLIHAAIWAVLFLLPLSFMHRQPGFSYLHYFMTCGGVMALMYVFYMNYLWLTPRYFMTGRRQAYWAVNIVVIIALGVLVHVWYNYIDTIYTPPHRPHHEPSLYEGVIFSLRHVFNLSVAAAIATTIKLAMNWRDSEEARLQAEAARADAELRNLRSQINPHFLLNTLNNIYALTAIDQQRAQDAIQQLSKLLRHMLYDNQEQTVCLDDELQFLDNYVALMRIRLADNVKVTFDRQITKPSLRIAPLIFISLVENAFKHGISPTEPSFIHISVADSQLADGSDELTFTIDNSNHPKTQLDRSGHGIGLQQVQRRLELAYSDRYSWQRGPTDQGNTYHSQISIRL